LCPAYMNTYFVFSCIAPLQFVVEDRIQCSVTSKVIVEPS
jgi:hypothetical protein